MPTVTAGSLGPVRVDATTDTSGNVLSVTVVRDVNLLTALQGSVNVQARDKTGAVVINSDVTPLSLLPSTFTFTSAKRPTEATLQVALKWGRG